MDRFKPCDHTFVICAYKDSEYLGSCIRSLKSQSVRSKVLAVTSTPSEYITSIMQKANIPLFIRNGASDIASDWNFALSLVDTPLATIAHQDDVYLREYTSTMLAHMNAEERPLIFFSDYGEIRGERVVDVNHLLTVKRRMLWPLRFGWAKRSTLVRRRILSLGSPICCPSVTYNLSILQRPLFSVGYRSDLDWQAWERISRHDGSFVYSGDILMRHRIHEDSETSLLIRNDVRTAEDLEMLSLFWPLPIARLINHFYAKSQNSN